MLRPVDAFVSKYPQVYDYRVDPQWHQLTFYNTDPDHETKIGVNLSGDTADGALGLDPNHDYHVYDFWNDKLIGKLPGSSRFEQTLRPGEARMMSVHVAADYPQVISTDRHIMQGVVDLLGSEWDAGRRQLRGVSTVVGGEPYRLIIATNGYKPRDASVDGTIDQSVATARLGPAKEATTIHLKPHDTENGIVEASIIRPGNGPVAWMVSFDCAVSQATRHEDDPIMINANRLYLIGLLALLWPCEPGAHGAEPATRPVAAQSFDKTGLVLWLNAADAVVQDGKVTQISDRSGQGNDARHDTDPKNIQTNPTLVPNVANGQPVLRFSGKCSSFTFNRISDIRTVVWVLCKDPNAFKQKQELFVLGDAKSLDFHPGTHFTDTILHATPQYGSPLLQKGKAWLNGKSIDPRATDFPQKLSVITLLSNGNVEANQIAKDRQFPNRCWQGDIAEILLFNRPLPDHQRHAVETYLMRKYGISDGGSRVKSLFPPSLRCVLVGLFHMPLAKPAQGHPRRATCSPDDDGSLGGAAQFQSIRQRQRRWPPPRQARRKLESRVVAAVSNLRPRDAGAKAELPGVRRKAPWRGVGVTCRTPGRISASSPKSGEDDRGLQQSLADADVILDTAFNTTIHDREIRIDTGWVVKIGRGLDFKDCHAVREG